MSYSVEFTTAAARQVRKLAKPVQGRILSAVAKLADDPRPPGARKLRGTTTAWRIRVGEHRVLYDIADGKLTIVVVRVAHRREVYGRS